MACEILNALLLHSPDPIPTAIKANVTPGILRVLRELLLRPESVAQVKGDMGSKLSCAVSCLCNIMWTRTDDKGAAWEALIEADVVPLLCDLVTFGDEKLMDNLGRLISCLVMITYPGLAMVYVGELPRALGGLLKRKPPIAPNVAADTLFFMALKREELLMDIHPLGLGPSLKRLTRHKDPHTVSAAEQLLLIITKGKQVTFSPHVLRSFSPAERTGQNDVGIPYGNDSTSHLGIPCMHAGQVIVHLVAIC